jgi:hypothetical protein
MQKTRKIEKVTGSQDGKGGGWVVPWSWGGIEAHRRSLRSGQDDKEGATVCNRSAKRFAQDDGFVGGLEIRLLDMQKTRNGVIHPAAAGP